LQNKLRGNYA